MSLIRRFSKQQGDKAALFVECLSHMAIAGPESSFLEYTREWMKIVNRGGLFEVNDGAYHLFVSIELALCDKLKEHLQKCATAMSDLSDGKSSLIESVATDSDVQFHWSMQSVDIPCEDDCKELLSNIIELWLTIRGFSLAKTWLEQYKQEARTTSKKAAGLRRGLKRKSREE